MLAVINYCKHKGFILLKEENRISFRQSVIISKNNTSHSFGTMI